MVDRRETARERAREKLEQTAAAAATANSVVDSSTATQEPPPLEEPEPSAEETTSDAPAPIEGVGFQTTVPTTDSATDTSDEPSEDDDGGWPHEDGSATFTLTDGGVDGSTIVWVGDGKGGAAEDGTEAGLDEAEPEPEEPAPPPAAEPTPQPIVTSQEDPGASGPDPTQPVAGADGSGGTGTASAGPILGELTIDPVREAIEEAAENIRFPSRTTEPTLAAEVTRQREILRETGAPEPRGGGPGDEALRESRATAGAALPPALAPTTRDTSLDVFATRVAAPDAALDREQVSPSAAVRAGESRVGVAAERMREPLTVLDGPGAIGDAAVRSADLPPGLTPTRGRAIDEVPRPQALGGRDEANDGEAEGGAEPAVDAWALHRARQSLLDEPGTGLLETDASEPALPRLGNDHDIDVPSRGRGHHDNDNVDTFGDD